jgi:hypothetical protein
MWIGNLIDFISNVLDEYGYMNICMPYYNTLSEDECIVTPILDILRWWTML